VSLRAETVWFRAGDGALVHFDARDDGEEAHGVLLTVHGLGEHLGKYAEWREFGLAHGWHMTAYDQRGHGRTPGRRGDFHFADLVSDLGRALAVSADRYPGVPVFVVAHSLGALVALRYAAGERPDPLAGLALSGAPLALARDVPAWKRLALHALARVAPWFPLPRGTDPERLTRDPERKAWFAEDPLFHRRITPRAMVEIEAAMRLARAEAERVTCPLLFLVPQDDRIASPAATAEYAARVASDDVTVEQVPGALHEVLNDLGRVSAYRRICEWCAERAVPVAAGRQPPEADADGG